MKKIVLLLFCAVIAMQLAFGQDTLNIYHDLVKKADSLYNIKDYKASAFTYSDAFKAGGWKGTSNDRYNAACSWAQAGYPDSAFFNLIRITEKLSFSDYDHVIKDHDLISLYNDKRWQPLLDSIKSNKEKKFAKLLNKPVAIELDSIFSDDQKYRLMLDSVEKKYGRESKETNKLWKTINEKDSINLIKIKSILDKYGWLGADAVGEQGNMTLFLVIQHSDLQTQEKYLPMMQEAVKNKKAYASQLALLIDRVEMGNGRPQVYGSQITMKDDKFVVYKILDEANVNKRRAEVGLESLENYLRQWNIEYKLPEK